MKVEGYISIDSEQFESAIKDGCFIRVFCDGEELHGVVECDTDHGWAVVNAVCDAGNYVLDPQTNKVLTQFVKGTITAERFKP